MYWYDFIRALPGKHDIIASLKTPDLDENQKIMHASAIASDPAHQLDSTPDFQPVILRVKTKNMFPLLEEVDLHVTQSVLQLWNLLFSLTYFPLQFVLGRENEVLEMIQSTGQHLQTSNCLCHEPVTGIELPVQANNFILVSHEIWPDEGSIGENI